MSKEEQFLWGVQTLLLLYANHHAHDPEVRDDSSRVTSISAAAHVVTIGMALKAAARIPKDMDTASAVHAFHFAYVHRHADSLENDIPAWLTAL